MNLDITAFWRTCAPMDYSASVAEIGRSAGPDTWRAACDDSADNLILDNADKLSAFRDFVRSSGGWDDEEVAAFSGLDLNALCLQWISGDIREAQSTCRGDTEGFDWAQYEIGAESGRHSGRLYRAADGSVYFEIGE